MYDLVDRNMRRLAGTLTVRIHGEHLIINERRWLQRYQAEYEYEVLKGLDFGIVAQVSLASDIHQIGHKELY